MCACFQYGLNKEAVVNLVNTELYMCKGREPHQSVYTLRNGGSRLSSNNVHCMLCYSILKAECLTLAHFILSSLVKAPSLHDLSITALPNIRQRPKTTNTLTNTLTWQTCLRSGRITAKHNKD